MSVRKLMLFTMAVVWIVVAAVVVTGGNEVSAQDSVTLRFSTFDTGDGLERNENVIAAFTEETGINVEVELAENAADPAILVQMAAGTAPDVIQTGELVLRRRALAEEGGFLDLTPYIEADEDFGPEMFFDTVWNVGALDGGVYAFNKDFATVAYYVNTDKFEEAGIPIPEEGWTYDDLIDIGMELTIDASGNNAKSPDFDAENIVQYGWFVPHDWVRGWEPVVYSMGGQLLSDDGMTASGFINSPEVVKAVEFYRDAAHVYHIIPTVAALDAQPGVDLFGSGQAAIRGPRGPWHLTSYSENPDINFATVPMPAGEAGRYSVICWSGFGVNRNTEYPQESYELVKYLATVGQNTFVEHALSANIAANESAGYADDPLWGQFVTEIDNLHPLDDMKTVDFAECVEAPLKNLLVSAVGEAGADMDIQAELDDIAATADDCLAQ
ncbi:MAG: sugar ABC transporter substrate-binding protein [Anaerolineae bacterium]|nr:sugar ABC transporter substrate-binding protein [Anaerolineae bacterium]